MSGIGSFCENYTHDFDFLDRKLLSYIYIPILQRELDIFRTTVWNNHRSRKQKDKLLPAGIPEHIYKFPERYGGSKCGISLTDDDLMEVTDLADVMESTEDYLEAGFRQECENHVTNMENLKCSEAIDSYLTLKEHFNEYSI